VSRVEEERGRDAGAGADVGDDGGAVEPDLGSEHAEHGGGYDGRART
jgi:hypothetical protein